MNETYYERMRKRALQRKKDVAIARAMVEKEEESNKIMGFKDKEVQKKAAVKKLKDDSPIQTDVVENTEVNDSVKAGLDAAMQGGSTLQVADTIGKAAIASEVSGAITAGAKAAKAAGAAAKAAGTTATIGAKAGAGMKAAAASFNPYIIAGAAAIGLLSAAEQRKQRKRQAEGQAEGELAKGKEKEAAIYENLSKSIQGILV